MHELKMTITLLAMIVLTIAFIIPVQAQFPGDPGPFGGPDDYQFPGDSMGMGPFGMSMPFMSPFGSMRSRNSEHVTQITRLPAASGYGDDLMATLESDPQLSLFTAALKATGYDQKLKSRGNYVVFAPSDKAVMRDLSVKDAGSLVSDTKLVTGLVENCIVNQPSGQHDKDKAFVALNGKEIKLLKARTGVSANGADVSDYIQASNGLVIVTDGPVGT